MIASDFVAALKPHAHFIPICAEMEIGLGIPRSSIRIASVKGELRLIQPATVIERRKFQPPAIQSAALAHKAGRI